MTDFLLASPSPGLVYFPDLAGGLVVDGADPLVVPIGVTDVFGDLEVSIAAPNLPSGVAFARFHTQPLYFHPLTAFFLGSGSTLEILDAGI